MLGQIKSAPGDVSLNSMLAEILKLDLARGLGLPPGMFAGIYLRDLAAVATGSPARRAAAEADGTAAAMWCGHGCGAVRQADVECSHTVTGQISAFSVIVKQSEAAGPVRLWTARLTGASGYETRPASKACSSTHAVVGCGAGTPAV